MPLTVLRSNLAGDSVLLRERLIRRRGNRQQQAAFANHAVGVFQCFAAYRIQQEIDTPDLGGRILGAIVDHLVSAEGFDELDVGGRRRRDDVQAGKLGELDSECANAARTSVDEHLLARGEPRLDVGRRLAVARALLSRFLLIGRDERPAP